MSKILIRFTWDVGRMGSVQGLFVTTQKEIDKALGKHVYFGEILGKHSEVYGNLDRGDLAVVNEDQEFIAKLVDVIGSRTISGYNPLDYLEESEESE